MKAKLIGICDGKNENFYILSFGKKICIVQENVFVDDCDNLVIGQKYEIEDDFFLVFSKKDFLSFDKSIAEAAANLLYFEHEAQVKANEKK